MIVTYFYDIKLVWLKIIPKSSIFFISFNFTHTNSQSKCDKKTQLTLFEETSRAIPTGRKTIPIRKNTGRTVEAVRIGCHAGSFCCLNFESKIKINHNKNKNSLYRSYLFTHKMLLQTDM